MSAPNDSVPRSSPPGVLHQAYRRDRLKAEADRPRPGRASVRRSAFECLSLGEAMPISRRLSMRRYHLLQRLAPLFIGVRFSARRLSGIKPAAGPKAFGRVRQFLANIGQDARLRTFPSRPGRRCYISSVGFAASVSPISSDLPARSARRRRQHSCSRRRRGDSRSLSQEEI